MMKKITLALAAALVLGAAPAWAGSTSADMISPGNGQTVSGTTSVKGQASSEDGLSRISLVVNGQEVAGFSPTGNSAEVSYIWDTKYYPESNSLSSNGDYSAYVKAVSKTGEEAISEIIILVDNAPTVPRGVSTSVSGSTVTVSWMANPEPDITGYRVERSSGGSFSAIGTASGTSLQDNPGGGDYTYRVAALRSSPTAGSRSSVASSTARAYVNGPPPSTADGGTGGGGYPSGGSSSGGYPSDGSHVAGISRRGKGGLGNLGDPKDPWGSGLPDFGLSLPGISGLMGIPSLPGPGTIEWGDYEPELPYNLPQQPGVVPGDIQNIAARAPDRIIPPDGLRWVAAGLLLIMGATMLRFGAVRLGVDTRTATPSVVRFSPAPPVVVTAATPMTPPPPPPAPPPVEEPDPTRLSYLRARF